MMGPVFLSSIGFAMILAPAAGMALAPFGHCAGTAAALLGLFQMSGSGVALVGFIGALMHDPEPAGAAHVAAAPAGDADDPPGSPLVFAINPVL